MNRTFYAVIIIVTGVLVTSGAFAQNDPQFSLYMLNPVYYNPATAGSEGTGRFQLVNRTQYAGYQGTFDDGGTPSTQLFSFNVPLASIRSGVGFYALNETFGPQSVQSVQAAYAFRLPLKKGTLALGVQGGLHNISINYDRFRYNDPDPLLPTGRYSQMKPDISAGIYYSTDAYYIGASMKHLNRPAFSLGAASSLDILSNTAYLTAGYRYQWNDALELMPSLIYQYVASPTPSVNASSFQVGLTAFYDKKYWAGLAYRRADALTATAGISFLRNNALRFGYAFDFVVTNQLGKSPTSHEVLLSYSLPEPRTGRKPIIRTPRFRY